MFLEYSIQGRDMLIEVTPIPDRYYRPQSNKKKFTLPRKDSVKINLLYKFWWNSSVFRISLFPLNNFSYFQHRDNIDIFWDIKV